MEESVTISVPWYDTTSQTDLAFTIRHKVGIGKGTVGKVNEWQWTHFSFAGNSDTQLMCRSLSLHPDAC